MTKNPFLPLFGLSILCSAASHAQESVEAMRLDVPKFDIVRASVTQTGGMDLDGNPGDLSVTSYDARAFLSQPIELFEGINMVPFFAYQVTQLDFAGTGPIPIGDEDVHSASLQAMFFKDFANSPWLAVGWTRAELATDYQGISSDDFTFDVSAGLAYKFNDTFTLGAGFAVIDLNGRERFFPAINFDWTPTDNIRVGMYGPYLFAKYSLNDAWYLSVEGSPNGGVWNINDDLGRSRNLDLSSYLIGVNTHHRITGEIWMSLGVGYTFANEIEIRDNGPTFNREMDGAPYAQISVSLREW